jgi:hypothetical protein
MLHQDGSVLLKGFWTSTVVLFLGADGMNKKDNSIVQFWWVMIWLKVEALFYLLKTL